MRKVLQVEVLDCFPDLNEMALPFWGLDGINFVVKVITICGMKWLLDSGNMMIDVDDVFILFLCSLFDFLVAWMVLTLLLFVVLTLALLQLLLFLCIRQWERQSCMKKPFNDQFLHDIKSLKANIFYIGIHYPSNFRCSCWWLYD